MDGRFGLRFGDAPAGLGKLCALGAGDGKDPRVTALMIEVRRDVCMLEPGGPAGPGPAGPGTALAELVEESSRPEGDGKRG